MSKMIKEMEELKDTYINENRGLSAHVVDRCIEIAKKHKNKKKCKCVWVMTRTPVGFPIWTTDCGKHILTYQKGIDVYCRICGKKIKVNESEINELHSTK